MAEITSLIKVIPRDYPDINLQAADSFSWIPTQSILRYDPCGSAEYLLHELAHAVLGHTSYHRDIDLLRIERDAWEYAELSLSSQYNTPISHDTIQGAMDSYREWLHARSICPACQATGLQVADLLYSCPACLQQWTVNEARTCRLRRYTKNTP